MMEQHLPVEFNVRDVPLHKARIDIEEVVVLFHTELSGRTDCVVQFPPNYVTTGVLSAVDVRVAVRGDEIGVRGCVMDTTEARPACFKTLTE
mmetsp:Transcript_21827/g.31328  ORF Transcript_21827/g.31328 Transcript_21827/m.31328 type:complete len:92 (-) Transcript_21827:201-476(-)